MIRRLMASSLTGAVAVVAVAVPAHATTASEEMGCSGYKSGSLLNLYNSEGHTYRGEGAMLIMTKKVKGKKRTCVTGLPAGKKAKMSVKLGTRAKNGTKVKWSTNPEHVDSGTVSRYIGGVAATASKGRCVVAKVTMIKGGDRFSRTAAPTYTCN